MKSLFLLMLLLSASVGTLANDELAGQLRAAQAQNADLLGQLRTLKLKNSLPQLLSNGLARDRRDCDPRETCVPRCTWRKSDGTCLNFAEDFCAPNARCAPNCEWRASDGSCNSYAEDYCGSDANCSPNCTWRSSTGSCNSYGPDVCS